MGQKVLLIASGHSATQVNEYEYKANGWTIVAINNGWQATDDWDWWIAPPDYKGTVPVSIKPPKQKVPSYGKSLGKFGGQIACGYSITLNAGYWALDQLKPDVIGFLGADMDYTPDAETGHTHFYGVGFDIEANGIADPDRMVDMYAKGNDNYLTEIYQRLSTIAGENGCKVYNLSQGGTTRLPYPRANPSTL